MPTVVPYIILNLLKDQMMGLPMISCLVLNSLFTESVNCYDAVSPGPHPGWGWGVVNWLGGGGDLDGSDGMLLQRIWCLKYKSPSLYRWHAVVRCGWGGGGVQPYS